MYVCNIRNLPSSFIFVGDDGSAAGASAGATIDLVFLSRLYLSSFVHHFSGFRSLIDTKLAQQVGVGT